MSTYRTGSGITDETTATRRELISAIERNRQYLIGAYAFDQVDFLLRDIMKHRGGPGESLGQAARDMRENVAAHRRQQLEDKLIKHRDKIMGMEETFTAAELKATLLRENRAGYMSRFETLIEDMKAHRDPDLDDGCVVIDASNDLWQYTENGDEPKGGWHVFGETHVYPFGDPKRPIERVDVEAVKSRATY